MILIFNMIALISYKGLSRMILQFWYKCIRILKKLPKSLKLNIVLFDQINQT
jgi:hypothetical protein